MPKEEFLFPVIYNGPQEVKDVAELLGSPQPVLFKLGPLSEQPGPLEGQKYCDVSEKHGRLLVKRFPTIFAWPEGTDFGPQLVTREEHDAVLGRLDALEGALADLRGVLAGKAPAKTAKGKEAADAVTG